MNAPSAPAPARPLLARPAALLLVLVVALGSRLAALPQAGEARLPPDAAHFLNVAGCFARGEGFSNPSAWPAWMAPARLPMPETFKEPGFPFLIATLARLGLAPYAAGQALAFAAGLLLPFATWWLARRIVPEDEDVATFAALFAAASPLLVAKSVSVLVESPFALTIAAAFLAASWRPAGGVRGALAQGALTGALFGGAWLLRAQVLLALPPLVLLAARRRPARETLVALAAAAPAAALVLSPFIARNLRLFGVPFYSDVTAYGIWPYVDTIAFSHGLDRPPAPIPFALAHVPQVLAHVLWSLKRFFGSTLPREVLGPFAAVAFVAGLVVSARDLRRWLFAWAYVGGTVAFIAAVHWDSYYFTSTGPAWCLLAAVGTVWALRRASGALRVGLCVVIALSLAWQARAAVRNLGAYASPELAAARHEAPWLAARLGPDEAVMVNVTSWWAYFTGRHAVHLVIADDARFLATVRRLRVRWAALPTHLLPVYASHYPGGHLPAALVLDHVDPERDLTVFRVVDPGTP